MNCLIKGSRAQSIYCFSRLNIEQVDTLKTIVLERPQRTFKPGQKAPYAYNAVYDYPEGYRPWTINYTSDGLFLAFFGLAWFSYFQYEQVYLERTEQEERVDRPLFKP